MSRESIKESIKNYLIGSHNNLQDCYLEENGGHEEESITLDGRHHAISNDFTSSSCDSATEYADDEMTDILQEILNEWKQDNATKEIKQTLGAIVGYSQQLKQQLNA